MFETALVALDLSPAERPILECLPALRHWGVRHLVLTHVIQIGYAQGAALAHERDYLDWLETCAEPLRAAGLSVAVQIRASGVPVDEIRASATETGADLIVIGSRGQNLLSTLFLGSVARGLIRTTTVPLLLEWIEPSATDTRARCEAVCTDTLRHVLLATDFSRHAAAAERAAIALASRAQRVECVHVLAPEATPAAGAAPTAAQTSLDALVRRIEGAGGRATGILLSGTPSSEIARHATHQNASLIVVGKRGQDWLVSTLIGSTATNLCELAGRRVLMVP